MFVADLNTGGETRQLPASLVEYPASVAVDWVTGNVYFTNRQGKSVDVLSADAAHHKTVVLDYLSVPTDIAVDPTAR